MSMNIKTPGVHHVAIRCADLERSKRFYTETLGFQLLMDLPGVFLFAAGSTTFGVRGPEADTPAGGEFNPQIITTLREWVEKVR